MLVQITVRRIILFKKIKIDILFTTISILYDTINFIYNFFCCHTFSCTTNFTVVLGILLEAFSHLNNTYISTSKITLFFECLMSLFGSFDYVTTQSVPRNWGAVLNWSSNNNNIKRDRFPTNKFV
ncbi:hypothetical protein DU504_17460 [Haloplanus salinus]|uniref:Uncharacterized protein n=1 Tax=Haloplanus salinus TaxID=1126245 RepID=A0A368N2D7_9EURY|nr:hypothetical protein DU504_17460 [Haloplanus salinus]